MTPSDIDDFLEDPVPNVFVPVFDEPPSAPCGRLVKIELWSKGIRYVADRRVELPDPLYCSKESELKEQLRVAAESRLAGRPTDLKFQLYRTGRAP